MDLEKIPSFVPSARKKEEGNYSQAVEKRKSELQQAIRSGDVRLALDKFLSYQETLPKVSGDGRDFDYTGNYAKEIMSKAIKSVDPEKANFEDVKFVVEVYLSLKPHFPTTHRGQEANYVGLYAEDVLKAVIKVAKDNKSEANIKLARETFSELSRDLRTERNGQEFDYAAYYRGQIEKL